MSETLTFGPQWLRALSSGNSVTSPPPSPGPKYKMAEYRYGKEEMLALFIEDLVKPIELDHFSSISKTKSHFPLAFIPPTEEEQRYSLGSVNSNAVLKLMGRGAPRGAARGVRGGLGGRGRGRGDGGYMRQSSYEDSRPETGGFRDPRRQGWEESRRGGFDRGNASGRGYDPTMRGRLSSDTTWDKNDKGHENWRSGVQHDAEDDGGGWRVSGQRSFDKSDRWRGGSKISRSTSWRNSDSFRDEKNFGEEEWQVARGPRARSFHERDDRPWNHPSEPEWCKDDDFEDLDVAGTFDSSGAFRSQKKEETRSDASVKELNNQEAKLQTDGKDENVHEQKEPNHNENRSNDEKPHTKQQIEEKSTTASGGLTSSGRPVSELTTSTTQENVQVTSVATTSQPAAVSTSPTHKTDEKAPQFRLSAAKSEEREVNDESESDKKEDEPNMEHFAKAAENLVMSLDDEVEKSDPDSQPPGFHAPPVTAPTSQLEEIKWFYTDPQGKMQGPFTNTEMADWFNHGYFTMSLMIKRSIDEAFQPLGELIKSWGRVPFLPGPQPPPLKGMPDQIQQQQHLLAQQQQYQQLLQQHMIQQRFLQQQAIIMQQQLQMHRQQEQQAPTTTTSPHSTSSHMEVPPPHLLQTTLEHQQHLQALQQQQLQQHQLQQQLQQQQQQQQQQQRPQALSVSSESIWGGSGTTSTSPGMSPGPWSPVSTASPASTVSAAARGWDVEHGNKEKIQSLQEIQRIEEEKERAIKLEKERREAALRQEEELRKRQQQEFLMQRQREEEERRRQEETEKKKREQEEILKKQQEEELRKQQQLAERQKQVEEQKRQMEEQKMIEMRKQQQQALVRLQQQQQELQRRKEIELQKQKELQLKLQQKRQQSQNGSSTLWGPAPASAAPSLTEIQQQQEKRERNAQQEKERVLQHEREQQQRNAAATAGWTERNSKGPSNVKSLVEIQQEQERQLAKKQNQQLSRSHPQQQSSHNPFSSSVWGNNSSVLSSWAAPTSTAPSTNAWGGASKMGKQTTQFAGNDDDDDDDDDDEDDDEEESFWDEAVKEAKKAGQSKQQPKQQQQQKKQQQQQQPKGQFVQHKNKQPSNAAFPGLGNKCQAKRPNKDEENVRRIFQQQASASDEFAGWFEKSLRTMKVTSIDIPTFFAFLKDVESPYEVHDYVKSYVGDSKEAHEFARDFIEQRKQAPSRKTQNTQPLPEDSVWGNGNPKPLPSKTCGNQQQQQQPQEDYVQNVQADSTTNKRKKKKKMQKVDPRILGFSVNAAERVNIGEIQTLEDA